MKKIITLALCTAIALSPVTAANLKNEAACATAKASSFVGMPSPWQECKSMDKAAELAGFSLNAPKTFKSYERDFIQVIEDELFEVSYSSGKNSIVIRKGIGKNSVSGDYTEYSQVKKTKIGKTALILKGNKNKIYLAAWENKNYSFSISSSIGLSKNNMIALVKLVG